MKRKVTQIGPSTLMVSLPIKWVKKNNVKKGDEIDLNLSEKQIIFSKENTTKQKKEITLDITGYERKMVTRTLDTLYIDNYDKITFKYEDIYEESFRFKKKYKREQQLKELSMRFIGLEITSQSAHTTEFSCFLHEKNENYKEIENKIILEMKKYLDIIEDTLKKDPKNIYKETKFQHTHISKYITYYLRIINNSEEKPILREKTAIFYSHLDKVSDDILKTSLMINENGVGKETPKILKEVFIYLKDILDMIKTDKKTKENINEKYDVERKLDAMNLKGVDIQYYASLRDILSLIKPLMILNLAKKFK